MLCGEHTLAAFDDRAMYAKRLRCKRWKCEDCVPDLRRRVMRLAADGEPTTLLTLTTNPAREPDPARAADLLLSAFNRLVRRLRKTYGRNAIEYLAVWETTQRGMPHLHILMRSPYIDQKSISRFMEEQIEAPIVDIRAVHGRKQAAAYVAKYLGKDPKCFGGHHHYMFSRHWLDPAAENEYERWCPDGLRWRKIPAPLDKIRQYQTYYYDFEGDDNRIRGTRRPPPWMSTPTLAEIEQIYGFTIND